MSLCYLATINMAEDLDVPFITKQKYVFKTIDDNKMQTILDEKDKKNTQKATQSAVSQFEAYLKLKNLPNIMDIDLELLASTLRNYYVEICPQKDENYAVQSLKCKRAALNRFFKPNRGIDIILDPDFTRANEMFKGVLVQSKKSGKGVKKSYPKITPDDMEKISSYFTHDYMNMPDPKKLQCNLLFYIVYFFCRRGRENLYDMKKNTFRVVVEPDGSEYVIQNIDKADKKHGPDDSNPTNEGRMYGDPCKCYPTTI